MLLGTGGTLKLEGFFQKLLPRYILSSLPAHCQTSLNQGKHHPQHKQVSVTVVTSHRRRVACLGAFPIPTDEQEAPGVSGPG